MLKRLLGLLLLLTIPPMLSLGARAGPPPDDDWVPRHERTASIFYAVATLTNPAAGEEWGFNGATAHGSINEAVADDIGTVIANSPSTTGTHSIRFSFGGLLDSPTDTYHVLIRARMVGTFTGTGNLTVVLKADGTNATFTAVSLQLMSATWTTYEGDIVNTGNPAVSHDVVVAINPVGALGATWQVTQVTLSPQGI